MDKKWLVAGIGLLCLLLSSRTPHWFRGLVMPITAFVLFFAAGLIWISDRMGTLARDQVYVPSPEEIAAIERARLERLRAVAPPQGANPLAVIAPPPVPSPQPTLDLQAKLAAIRQAEATGQALPASPPPMINPAQPVVKPNVADLQAKLAALRAAEKKAQANPPSPT